MKTLLQRLPRWTRLFYVFFLLIPLYSFPQLLPSANATNNSAPHFTFVVAGDWGGVTNSSNTSGTAGWMVVKKIASSGYNPNFTIALGDLGYSDQNPKNWCGNFTRISSRMVFITGNHDTLNSTGAINYDDGTSSVPRDALTSEKADGLSGFLDPVTGMNG